MKHSLLIVLAAAALAGCGHDVYRRTDTTDTQYIRDSNICLDEAQKHPPAVAGQAEGGLSMNIEKVRQDIRACMKAKGYALQAKWPFGPYGTSPTTGPDPARAPLDTHR